MRYNKDTCTVEMSVRSLCALALKTGDIDARRRTSVSVLVDGARIHRKLQSEAAGYYNPEVSLVNTTLFDGMYYTVNGRADGVIRREGGLCVDEIKTVRPFEFYMPPSEAHIAQMKCYAYFLAVRDELEHIDGRITYFNTENDKVRYFNYSFNTAELREYYISLLERISPFARIEATRTLDVLGEAANAVFPYSELREGQEIMIRECYGAVKHASRLFVQAPTGTGKTISSLFGAVRALGEERADKIFYLTAKASTRREAYRASAKLHEVGVSLRTVVLNAKESMCACRCEGEYAQGMCEPERCQCARGYYDRVNAALLELLEGGNGYPASLVSRVAKKHGVCPYELSLDLSEYCDIIICDYNYAFDPSVYLRRYFADGGRRERYVFLIDEAHNLADRARDMYSAVLARSELERVRALIGESEPLLDCAFGGLSRAFDGVRGLCRDSIVKDADGNERGFYMERSPLTDFGEALEGFRGECERWLKKNRDSELYDPVSAFCSAVRKYICVNEYFDKGFLCYAEIGGGDITVKTYCLDPSSVMNTLLERALASVMFSATLAPAEYFCDVLGCRDKSISVELPSPFDTDNLQIAIADYLSTRYEDRANNIAKYVSVIAATVSARAGNYIVYFPSYDCLEKVHKAFSAKYPKVKTVVQKRSMRTAERDDFLSSFKDDSGKLRVGFCVLGGMFAEGVDLPGSRLIGTVIFGVGLPGLSNERNIIRDYFDEDMGTGYDYAYTYPGMNNVLQAAGRVIRTDSDRGIVVLVDDRYGTPLYRKLFPAHWKNIHYAGNAASLAEISRRFWENGD